MKKNLYVNEGEIKREGNVLKINNKKIPLSMIDNLFLFDRVKMSISARNMLLKNKRSIFYLNKKHELIGILVPEILRSDMRRRIWQWENRNNLDFAKLIVLKKLEAVEGVFENRIDAVRAKLESAKSLNEILGIEGYISRFMFEILKKKLRSLGIKEFVKRAYNPPPDRVNALLGFLYTLYYSHVFAQIISFGFDPYVGFLHQKRGTHAVFASDVMEEARVKLTFLAVDILKKIYPHEFEGKYLSLNGRKEVLREFDRFVLSYENSILNDFKEMAC